MTKLWLINGDCGRLVLWGPPFFDGDIIEVCDCAVAVALPVHIRIRSARSRTQNCGLAKNLCSNNNWNRSERPRKDHGCNASMPEVWPKVFIANLVALHCQSTGRCAYLLLANCKICFARYQSEATAASALLVQWFGRILSQCLLLRFDSIYMSMWMDGPKRKCYCECYLDRFAELQKELHISITQMIL